MRKLSKRAQRLYNSFATKPLGVKLVYGIIALCLLGALGRILTVPGKYARAKAFWDKQAERDVLARAALFPLRKGPPRREELPHVMPTPPFPRRTHRPVIRQRFVNNCESRNLTDIAGMPPCQDEAPEPGEEQMTAKVAIMFLTKDIIPTEPIWSAFMVSAAELKLRRMIPPTRPAPPQLFPDIPRHASEWDTKCWRHGGMVVPLVVPPRPRFRGQAAPRITNVTAFLEEGCIHGMTGRQAYLMQDLFTVYVHRSPGAEGAPPDSMFYGRDIPQRVQGVFAQPSLVAAVRLLLAEALMHPGNSMFTIVSESCIPIYHPALYWAQLISESHSSRMSDGMFGVHRWAPQMSTNFLKPGHFRKGSQFASLSRLHAQYIAYDQHVWTQFEAYCKTQMMCNQNNRHAGHICVADEHFIATLLSAYKMKDTFDRVGIFAFTDWKSEGGWHPKTFYPGDSVQAVYTMRTRAGPAGCDAIPLRALQTAGTLFEHRDVCHASGDRMIKIAGRFSEPFADSWRRSRSLLAAAGLQDESDDLFTPAPPFVQARQRQGVSRQGRRLQQGTIPPEYGYEREKIIFGRASRVVAAQRDNLRRTKWMGTFEPMMPACPLTARKVAPEAVSEFAALAWRCDGLGFAWDCLRPSAPIEDFGDGEPPPGNSTQAAGNAADTQDALVAGATVQGAAATGGAGVDDAARIGAVAGADAAGVGGQATTTTVRATVAR